MSMFDTLLWQKTIRGGSTESKLLDNTATFMVDGKPYEIISVKNGNLVNAPTTDPTSADLHFCGWYTNGNKQEFPFTPTEDCEIVAEFSSVRKEMEFKFAGELIATVKKSGVDYPITKTNDGVVVCGTAIKNSSYYVYAIAINPETADCCVMSESLNNGEIIYNNKSYYYHVSRVSTATSIVCDAEKVVNVGTGGFMDESIAKTILDRYYRVS